MNSIADHGRDGQMQHPRSMGGAEVTQFLTMLANERRVSMSTHYQALSALLFLYRDVLAINLPWLTEVQRPTRPRRIPSVLTRRSGVWRKQIDPVGDDAVGA